jgi:hypothetical protein
MRRPFALSALITLAAACSGSGPVPLERYCEEYAKVTCAAADHCGCLDDLTRQYCTSFQASECQDDVVAPVQSGTRSYDAAEAGRCLSGLRGVLGDCSVEGDYWPEACDRMLVGLVPAGQACAGDDECVPPLECQSSVCTAMPGDGQPCLEGSYCAADLYCGEDDSCHVPRGRGGACPEGDEACADDLYCDSRTTTCQPMLGSGESCAHASWACGEDLYCSPATSTCKPDPGAGGDCADSSGTCAEGFYCDGAMVCQATKPGGAACADDEECRSYDCADGACSDATATCPFM